VDENELSRAIRKLKDLPRRRLDGDWLAVDASGRVGFFAGGDSGPIPESAMPHATPEAVQAIGRALAVRRSTSTTSDAYRGFAERLLEPIFDRPAGHEGRYDGYAHLFVAGDAEVLQAAVADGLAHEALSREALAVVFPSIGSLAYDDLHERAACGGCRVLDAEDDPRPTAPELLAAAGLYAYRHAGTPGAAYVRIASPSASVDLHDLEPIVRAMAELVVLPVDFESLDALDPATLVAC
jgi:hypothetical protein